MRMEEPMTLDPQVAAYLASLPVTEPVASLDEMRRQNTFSGIVSGGEAIPLAQVHNRTIPGPAGEIPVRIYRPTPDNALLPVVLYFHGGGWVLGNLDTHDNICRSLAKHTPCVVIAVDYRLAPEHKYPAALEDAEASLLWMTANAQELAIDTSRIAVAGDSAGGNITAALTLLARDKGYPPLAAQALIYPVTDYYTVDHDSYTTIKEGYGLTAQDMRWFWDQYLSTPDEGEQAYAAPLRAQDLSHLPPALVLVAEYDPLRDEGQKYAQRLQGAGVPTKFIYLKGLIHSFFRMNGVFSHALEHQRNVAAWLHTRFTE